MIFQSTPSQRGRQQQMKQTFSDGYISIHALAKRATERKAIALAEKAISIHALAKRATVNNDTRLDK